MELVSDRNLATAILRFSTFVVPCALPLKSIMRERQFITGVDSETTFGGRNLNATTASAMQWYNICLLAGFFFSVHQRWSFMSLLSSENISKHRSVSAPCTWKLPECYFLQKNCVSGISDVRQPRYGYPWSIVLAKNLSCTWACSLVCRTRRRRWCS